MMIFVESVKFDIQPMLVLVERDSIPEADMLSKMHVFDTVSDGSQLKAGWEAWMERLPGQLQLEVVETEAELWRTC